MICWKWICSFLFQIYDLILRWSLIYPDDVLNIPGPSLGSGVVLPPPGPLTLRQALLSIPRSCSRASQDLPCTCDRVAHLFHVKNRTYRLRSCGKEMTLSGTLNLLWSFDLQTRDLKPHTGWRKMFQNAMWIVSGYVAFYLLGFWVEVRGKQAARKEAPVLIVAPHSSFLDVFTIALCFASPVARIENKETPFLWAPQAIGHTIFVNRLVSIKNTSTCFLLTQSTLYFLN